MQPRFVDHLVVHVHAPALPAEPSEQLLEQSVGSGHPTGDVVDPRVVIEVGAHEPAERGVDGWVETAEKRSLQTVVHCGPV